MTGYEGRASGADCDFGHGFGNPSKTSSPQNQTFRVFHVMSSPGWIFHCSGHHLDGSGCEKSAGFFLAKSDRFRAII